MAIKVLVGTECRELVDCDGILTNMLRYMARSLWPVSYQVTILAFCERLLRNNQLQEEPRQAAREMRIEMTQIWLDYVKELSDPG